MKRYNCKHGPAEMVESDDGYWIKHSDAAHILEHSTSMAERYHKKYYEVDEEAFDLTRKVLKLKSLCICLAVSTAVFLGLSIVLAIKLSSVMYG